jgi:hypothetical protein
MKFEDAGRIKVKGKTEPIAVYRPIKLLDTSAFGTPVPNELSESFIEVKRVPEIMEQLRENKKRVVFINGDEREALYVFARILYLEAGKFNIECVY